MPEHGAPSADNAPPPEKAPPMVLEERRRLSESLLWDLQREYFKRTSIDAWRKGAVPHYVTSNPALAAAYAQVMLGLFRDHKARSAGAPKPMTIVELGVGHGRFSFLFLKAFLEILEGSTLADVPFRYVMTDVVADNVAFWRSHPALSPLVQRGILDFALFDVENGSSLSLLESGESISPETPADGLVVIANYVFDGVVHDAFCKRDWEVLQMVVSLSCDDPVDPSDPAILPKLRISYDHEPAPDNPYGDPDLDPVLHACLAAAGDERDILFPVAALRCLRRLEAMSAGGLFVLAGDRGAIEPGDLAEIGIRSFARHGSFSLNVNYHALAEYAVSRGGRVLKTPHRQPDLTVSGFLLGRWAEAAPETAHAFDLAITRGGPDAVYSVRTGIESSYEDMDISQLLSLIRLTCYDVRVVADCVPALQKLLETTPPPVRREVVDAIARAWANYYHIGEKSDIAYELGFLAQGYNGPKEALSLYEASIRLWGDRSSTQSNMALCHFALGDHEASKAHFASARRIADEFIARGRERRAQG